jgi:hypothetical protein
MSRHICTPEAPYRERLHGPAAEHPDAVYQGERHDGGNVMALLRCPHCYTRILRSATVEEKEEKG